MAENETKIILEMIDKASPRFKKAIADIIQEIKKTDIESAKVGKNIDAGLKKAGQELRSLRTQILPIVAIVGTMVVTTKEWAKTNANTANAFNDLNNAAKGLSSNIGSLLAPSIMGLSELVKQSTEGLTSFFDGVREAYASLFDSITRVIQYVVAFSASVGAGQGIMEAHAIATSVAAEAVEEMGAKFRETMTEVEQGYSLLQQAERNLHELSLALSDKDNLRKRTAVDEQISLLKHYEQTYRTAHAGMAAFTVTISKSIQTSLSTVFTNIVTGASTAKEAFTQLGKAMIAAVVQFMVQKVVASILEKTLLAGTVAASAAAASAVAAAWAPAAAMVFLATFGTNAVPAAAGIASVAAVAAGLAIAGKAVSVGTAAEAAGEINTLKGIQAGITTGFGGFQAEGGDYLVTKPTAFIAGESGPERATFTPLGKGGGSFGDINIFIQGGINQGGFSVEEMAEQLGFAFERETRLARGF